MRVEPSGAPAPHRGGGAAAPREDALASAGWTARIPDSLSALRFALAALWIVAFIRGERKGGWLGAIALVAAASDFLDGRLARRLGITSGAGRWLDSLADIAFVLAALGCESWAGRLPAYIPALIGVSFAQYAADSLVIGGRGTVPIRSRLGHAGGIINYALVMVLAFAPPPALPGTTVQAISPLLAIFYLAAIAERTFGYLRRARCLP